MEQLSEFIKNHKRDIIIFLLAFLISSLSFGLGYLVNREFNRAPIIIEKCSDIGNINQNQNLLFKKEDDYDETNSKDFINITISRNSVLDTLYIINNLSFWSQSGDGNFSCYCVYRNVSVVPYKWFLIRG